MKIAVSSLALFAMACATTGSGLAVQGQVQQAADGAPLQDARVSMSCPQALKESGLRLLATTDASGQTTRLAPPSDQPLVGGCKVFVTADGYKDVSYPVESVCSNWAGTRCTEVQLRARLKPEEVAKPHNPVRLTIEMRQDGTPFHQQELLAPHGQPATINLDNNGVPYKLTVVPIWMDDSNVSLEGTWSTGSGASGVVKSVTPIGEPITVDFGTDNIIMLLTPKPE